MQFASRIEMKFSAWIPVGRTLGLALGCTGWKQGSKQGSTQGAK
nr:MAG TPA: hypothetical protein [Caudoviricetes sp.]